MLENVSQFVLINSINSDTKTEVITLVWLMLAAAVVAYCVQVNQVALSYRPSYGRNRDRAGTLLINPTDFATLGERVPARNYCRIR